ncbi:MAG: peptidylprolyl isomerase [Candidatus Limnocylindria bacterium]
MTFRTRPVLDRKHRPRWQDELRTQQLTVVAFALAIAVAVGIFGAAAWNAYWESHNRPVASVAGTTYDRSDLDLRERVLVAEASATIADLQSQLGGPRDQIIQQQIESIGAQLSSLDTAASQSLVDGAVLSAQADAFGLEVTDDELDAAVAERLRQPERVRAQLILVASLPDDAEPDAEPTEEQIAAARKEAQAALDRVDGGEEFAAVATEMSDDFTASTGGVLGWFGEDDPAYGDYWEPLVDAETDELVGPIETDAGFAVLQLLDRREASTSGGLRAVLRAQGVDEAAYREHVRNQVLVDEFRSYFGEEVVTSPAPQRRVAKIQIAALTGTAIPQERARHVLIAPLPDADDQSEATDEQWAAALTEAEEVAEQLSADDADWFAIAEEHSDDPGSGANGGDLGWYDPNSSGFVPEFDEALASLDVGELSEPVRSDFGYHVIQKTGERTSPQAQAAELVEQLREDPDSFGEVASRVSEDYATAREDGEIGWVVRYQLDEAAEEVVFGLTEDGEITDPIDNGTEGITIYQLIETSESREIEEDRLEQIRSSGFDRWLEEEVRAPVQVWIDPQFASSAAT